MAVLTATTGVQTLPTRVVAAIAGVDIRTVERWRARVRPRPRHQQRLDELDAVLAVLGPGMTATAKRQWLEAPNAALDWDRPVEVLASGGFRRVLAAAQVYLTGDSI